MVAADHLIYTATAGSHEHFEAKLNAIVPPSGSVRRVALQLAHSLGIDRVAGYRCSVIEK